jgi:hypothetical protein
MTTTTTLQKKRKPNHGYRTTLFKAFVPLLAFIASFVSWQSAQAQGTYFLDDAIVITQQPVGATASNSVGYRGTYSDGDAPFDSYTDLGNANTGAATPNLGAYSFNSSALTITSGALVALPIPPATPRLPTITITGARVSYRVYLKATTSTLPQYTTVALPDAGAYVNGGQLYQNSSIANGDLLNGLSVSGRYVLEVVFQTTTRNSRGATGVDSDPSGSTYQAEFDFTAPPAPTLTGTAVYITPYSAAGNAQPRITYTVNSAATPAFEGANLGNTTYDLNTGLLLLNGGAAVTTEAGARTITSATMYYRVRQQGQGGGSYTAINLTQDGNVSSDGTRNFSLTNRTINLISSATVAGSYSVDIYYEAGVTDNRDPANPVATILSDRTAQNPYIASFNVTGTPIPTTVWTGGLNDNWFSDANWTNNVPTSSTNVVIANLGTNSPNPYPRILCNTTYTYINPTTNVSSFIDNTGKGEALARNLTMSGNSQADRSILSLVVGTLNVRGDFDNRYASFIVSAGTTVAFNGTNQSISGGTFANVFIAGGGVKSSQGVMNIAGDLNFNDGLLVTDITQPTVSVINLGDRAAINNNEGARLLNERDGSYLQGFVTITHRTVTAGTEDLFGNIGLGLKFYSNPGEILVTRNTAQAYSPGNGAASGVRRIFEVTQSIANTSGALRADMRFFYLDSETKNLGPGGNINIDENDLVVFASTNEGNTFNNLGGTPSASNNVVSLIGTNSFAVPTTRFTLGDKTNPLPVELVAFDAKRSGANASITWQTATEKNSAGFEVEVATDGVKFRKLAFVASKSANSTTAASYSYTDTEAGKTGVRYYRLRQVDIDGQYSYSPTRAVSFAGATDAAVASLSSYPSPFTSHDQAALVLQAPSAGTAQLQLTDLMGRTIASRSITTVAGISEIAVPNASELAVGTYLVKVTFATGEVKTLRIQKH